MMALTIDPLLSALILDRILNEGVHPIAVGPICGQNFSV
jgi:hypothetical protein